MLGTKGVLSVLWLLIIQNLFNNRERATVTPQLARFPAEISNLALRILPLPRVCSTFALILIDFLELTSVQNQIIPVRNFHGTSTAAAVNGGRHAWCAPYEFHYHHLRQCAKAVCRCDLALLAGSLA